MYIYIYIYIHESHSINYWILHKELLIGSTVYCCTFFKGINNYGSFHIWENWPLCPELFLYWSISVLPLYGLSFQPRLVSGKPMFSPFVKNFFYQNFLNFSWFALFSLKKFDSRPLFMPQALWFAAILIASRQINFALNQFQTNEFTEKILKKKLILLFSKKFPFCIKWPS